MVGCTPIFLVFGVTMVNVQILNGHGGHFESYALVPFSNGQDHNIALHGPNHSKSESF